MLASGTQDSTEGQQLKRLIENRQAIERDGMQPEDRVTDPTVAATNKKTDQYYTVFAKSLTLNKNEVNRDIVRKRMNALWSVTPAGFTQWTFRNVYQNHYIQGSDELSASEIKMRRDYQYWATQIERARPQYRAFQDKRTADDADLPPMTGPGTQAKKRKDAAKHRLRRLVTV
jgi:hypothetical protein